MSDYLVRGIGAGGQFRVFAAVTTDLAEEARRRHDTWPVASAALGRSLTAGLLLGANLKGDDLLTLRVFGDGPLGAIVVTANAKGEVKGYVQEPHVDLAPEVEGKLPVGKAVGKGFLYVTKDMGLKEPFTGSVELVSGEIAEDVAHYLLTSEQTPSAVALGVLVAPEGSVAASGGLMLQMFPGAEEDVLTRLEQSLSQLPPVSTLVNQGLTPEEIVTKAVGGLEVQYLEKNPVYFKCTCSRDRIKDVLAAMGEAEIKKILEEQGEAEVRCHFCGDSYTFNASELEAILSGL
ncbi:MAG TPA: Hsp33 family molecular chaperone HslO [Bacillota bacterium]|jgi:molecular chaperone Hsp33|nr:Hsp33 family molecular chaperone HslO [Peptococcaceae bacterium MAG4]NLW39248.1 Hsp33 family molecular chaperone HslO [Peptococcaceae bacterium]HPU35423.1 Hsp33 family molecular chaperone HslO [Bacillota bacterium]HPZ42851.1 Hsp33 family molecular chaperone HslO [Bacillota bacterium]HQD75606.1 Hsp33 family molecular chaperone HslO [Bacillota bacterium]